VLRGFSSETYVRRVRERVTADPRPAVLAYVGDHDASGEAILADWMARTGHCWTSVDQIALTRDQVLAYGLRAALGKPAVHQTPTRKTQTPTELRSPGRSGVSEWSPGEHTVAVPAHPLLKHRMRGP
jgi:hypothetical protein